MSERDSFDLTPHQYHAGLDKLWQALGCTSVQDDDVFTLASAAIIKLELENNGLWAIVNEHLHERKCWHCNNVAWHSDNAGPRVRCKECGSWDTRLIRKPDCRDIAQ